MFTHLCAALSKRFVVEMFFTNKVNWRSEASLKSGKMNQIYEPLTPPLSSTDNLETLINLTYMFFGWWEEAGVPGGNPHKHRETPGRTQGSTPGPSSFKADMLTNKSLCSTDRVKNLGVLSDQYIFNIKVVTKVTFLHLRNIVNSRTVLSFQDAEVLLHSLV